MEGTYKYVRFFIFSFVHITSPDENENSSFQVFLIHVYKVTIQIHEPGDEDRSLRRSFQDCRIFLIVLVCTHIQRKVSVHYLQLAMLTSPIPLID